MKLESFSAVETLEKKPESKKHGLGHMVSKTLRQLTMLGMLAVPTIGMTGCGQEGSAEKVKLEAGNDHEKIIDRLNGLVSEVEKLETEIIKLGEEKEAAREKFDEELAQVDKEYKKSAKALRSDVATDAAYEAGQVKKMELGETYRQVVGGLDEKIGKKQSELAQLGEQVTEEVGKSRMGRLATRAEDEDTTATSQTAQTSYQAGRVERQVGEASVNEKEGVLNTLAHDAGSTAVKMGMTAKEFGKEVVDGVMAEIEEWKSEDEIPSPNTDQSN